MNFQFYVEKLLDSKNYQDFINENSKAFSCSAFFIIDLENLKSPKNQQHFDFFIPENEANGGEMFSFKLEENCEKVPIEIIDPRKPEKISLKHDFEFEEIEDSILKEMEIKGINNKIQKIILSMQHLDGKDFLVGTVFISNLGIIKITMDIEDNMKIIDFEKKSVFDFIKKI